MKPISILFAVLFAFALAACGGGGGGSSTPEQMGPTQEQTDAANAAQMAATDAATAATEAAATAQAAVDAATLADSAAAQAAADAATAAATAATEAAAAVMAGDQATVDAANGAATAANNAAMAANDAATALNDAEMAALADAEAQRLANEAQMAATDAATAATEAAATAQAAVDAATLADSAAAQAAADAATAAATAATEAAAAVDAADPASVAAANQAAMDAQTAANAANDAAMALNVAEADAQAEAARVAAREEAMRVAGMIGPDAPLADYDGTGGTSDQIVSIDATTSMPTFQGDPASETSTDPRFTKSDDGPASIPGWKGGTYTRTTVTGGVTNADTVVKYNDKAPNTAAMYSTYFDGSTDVATRGYSGATAGVLTLANGTVDAPVMSKLYSTKFGLTAPHQTLPITHDNPDTTEVETTSSYTGSFTGVPGTFTCTGDGCSVSSDKDANLSHFVGAWTFIPDGIKNPRGGNLEGDALTAAQMRIMVPGVVPDPDFMILGYWMRTSTSADGTVTHSMRPIHDGLRDYADVSTVLGTARYTGPATGLYMSKTLTPQGQPTDPFTSGQFTANAVLNANFGGGEVAANHAFSISGTISNFMDGGQPINSAWVVNLNRRMIDHDSNTATPMRQQKNIGALATVGDRDGTSGTFDGVTDGGALGSAAGSWSGLFHGADDTTTTGVEQPASVSGMFDGHFSNGHVRGSFGANKQ